MLLSVGVARLLAEERWEGVLGTPGRRKVRDSSGQSTVYGIFLTSPHLYRHVARFCDSYLRGVASKAMTNIEQLLNTQITKFTDFEVLEC